MTGYLSWNFPEKSKRMNTSRTATMTIASTTTKALRPNTRQPKPSTRRILTTTTPKITTIYSTSTEKLVTSTEFRRGTEDADDDVDEITLRERTTVRVLETSTSFEEELSRIEAQEKSKILERDNEGVGLMTTLHSEEDLEPNPSSNTSSVSDLKNNNPLSKAVYKWSAFSMLYCLFLFVLE